MAATVTMTLTIDPDRSLMRTGLLAMYIGAWVGTADECHALCAVSVPLSPHEPCLVPLPSQELGEIRKQHIVWLWQF